MSIDGVLITDVLRIANEPHTSFFFLATGSKGSGKTFALRGFLDGIAKSGRAAVISSLIDLIALPDDSPSVDAPAPISVCWLDHGRVAKEGHKITALLGSSSSSSQTARFVRGTVLIVDDIDVLWPLCSISGDLRTLQQIVKHALAESAGCAIVASAKSLNSVPTTLLEWRRPIAYALPPLTVAAARRAVRAGFGGAGENVFADMDECAPTILPSTTRGSMLLAMCFSKDASMAEASTGGEGQQERNPSECLRWMETSASATSADEDGTTAAPLPTLFGLDAIYQRAHMLLSVFAASRGTLQPSGAPGVHATGKLVASLKGTTGILLHGPSGCGKSTLPRRLAADFPAVAFFFVKCPSLFSKYLGESEEKLRQVYRKARARAPAVVVLDDVDVIAQSRGSMSNADDGAGGGGGGVNVNKRMLAGLLCELDGVVDNSGVLTIGTTNAPEVIDSALLRQGRLETLMFVPPLDLAAAEAMCHESLAAFTGSPEQRGAVAALVARTTVGCTPAALRYVLRKVLEDALSRAPADGDAPMALPLPSAAEVGGVLLESSPMTQRAANTFDSA